MSPLRLIDANANRAREALRVMEDAARFALDDADLCARIKALRHDLAGALAPLERAGMIAWRDTPGDVGTEVTTDSESTRTTMRDIAAAAAKRLTEALRVIEECAKLPPPPQANQRAPADPGLDPESQITDSESEISNLKSEISDPKSQISGLKSQISDPDSQTPAHKPHPLTPSPSHPLTPSPPHIFESLRYRAYDIEKQLLLALPPSRGVFSGWRLCLLLTESLCAHHPWLEVARLALEGGADCIQLREKDLDDRELLARARALVELARRHGSESRATEQHGSGWHGSPSRVPAIIINDRPDIALLAGAHGLHLGQTDMPVREARRIVGFDILIGVSTSSIEQAQRALRDGADLCGVGPMFPSSTKHKPELAGPDYLGQYLEHTPHLPPPLAISGVTHETIPLLIKAAGGRPFGVAVSGAICAAENPTEATRRIANAMMNR